MNTSTNKFLLIAISILLLAADTYCMELTSPPADQDSEQLALPTTLPPELWRFIVSLAVEHELRQFRYSTHLQHHHTDTIWSVAFSFDGTTALTSSESSSYVDSGYAGAYLWDLTTGKIKKKKSGVVNDNRKVLYSPDESIIVIGSNGGIARLWEANTDTLLHRLEGHRIHSGPVYVVVFSPDKKIVVTGATDKIACLWDVETGTQIIDTRRT